MEALAHYPWPGNVRELRHVIESACVLCEGLTISLDHFPDEIKTPIRPSLQTGTEIQQSALNNLPPYLSEKEEIIEILRRTHGNKSKAARLLEIDRSTLYRKMHRLGIPLRH